MTASLADKLVTAIAVGTYSPGERLPPERELAASLHVGRDTLRQALQHVAGLGLLEARRGRGGGNFVATVSVGGRSPRGRPPDPRSRAAQDGGAVRLPVSCRGRDRPGRRRAPYLAGLCQMRAALEEFGAVEGMIGGTCDRPAAARPRHRSGAQPHLTRWGPTSRPRPPSASARSPTRPSSWPRRAPSTRSSSTTSPRVTPTRPAGAAQEHFALTLESMRAGLRKARDARPD